METQQPRDVLQAAANEELKRRYGHLAANCQMWALAEAVFGQVVDYANDKSYGLYWVESALKDAGDFLEDLRKQLNPLSKGGRGDPEACLGSTGGKDLYTKRLFDHEKPTNPDEWISFLAKHGEFLSLDDLFDKGTESLSYWPPQDLNGICSEYLTKPWYHRAQIDKLLITYMLYEAVIGIGETYKETVLGKRLYGYPATPLLISYSEGLKKQKNRNRMAWLFGWLFGLFMPGWGKHEHDHHEEERRVRGLYSEIRRIYELMDSSPLSPFYLRERLLAIAHKGVSWQVGIFPILDNAIARDPILWGTRHLRGFKPELIDDQP